MLDIITAAIIAMSAQQSPEHAIVIDIPGKDTITTTIDVQPGLNA